MIESGLSGCGSDWGSAFCVAKSFETILSLVFIVLILYEMVSYQNSLNMSKSIFVSITQVLMILALTFNIAFAVYHTTYALLYLEIYFQNMYFIVLSYYLIYNVFKRIKWMRLLIAGCVGFFSLVFVLILIDSFIQNVKTCKEVFYLIMNSIGLFISICMFSAYRYNELCEMQRIKKLDLMISGEYICKEGPKQDEELLKIKKPSRVNFNLPFQKIWIMIICNVIAQCVGLAESIAFQLDWGNNEIDGLCTISSNETVNSVSNLMFALLTMYLAFASTMFIFRLKRKTKFESEKKYKSPSDFSAIDSGRGNLQMVGKDSFSIQHHESDASDHLDRLYQQYHNQKRYRDDQYSDESQT